MIIRQMLPVLLCLFGVVFSSAVRSQGFAAIVSPPRFELSAQPGKTVRGVIEVSNRSSATSRFLIQTADWTLGRDFSVSFQDYLQPDSCRPWGAIERPPVEVPGGAILHYRFEVAVPTDAPDGECRFAVMIEGDEPSMVRNQALNMPITGRIGVIVYMAVGNGKPKMEILGPEVTTVNGQQVPTLRIHNGGSAHGRVGGFLTGTDAKGVSYDFTPADFPILPHEEREIFLTPSTVAAVHPTLTVPVTVKGTFEAGDQKIELNQRFE